MPDAMKKRLKKDKNKSPGAERVPRRKNSQVAPLSGMDAGDDVVDFGDDDYYSRGRRAVGEAFEGVTGGGLSAAMAMQPEGDVEAGMDADEEEEEERRRRRKERKREKKERERADRV